MGTAYSDVHVVGSDVRRAKVREQGSGRGDGVVSLHDVARGALRHAAHVFDDGINDHQARVGFRSGAQVLQDFLRILVRPVVQDVAEDERVGRARKFRLRLEEVVSCAQCEKLTRVNLNLTV